MRHNIEEPDGWSVVCFNKTDQATDQQLGKPFIFPAPHYGKLHNLAIITRSPYPEGNQNHVK